MRRASSCRLASLETRHAGQPIENRASSPRAVVECESLEAFQAVAELEPPGDDMG